MYIGIDGGKQCIQVVEGENLLQVLRREGVIIPAHCGGKGNCGKCKVQVLSDKTIPYSPKDLQLLSETERQQGYRLACTLSIYDDLQIRVKEEQEQLTRKSTTFLLPEWCLATIHNQLQERIDPEYGVAFDIGTTTVVGMLWDNTNGRLLQIEAKTNPQRVVATDVIGRIQYSMESKEKKEQLYHLIITCLNDMIQGWQTKRREQGCEPYVITKVCIVGNTTMSLLAQNQEVVQLIHPPYPEEFYMGKQYEGRQTELMIDDQAQVYYLPGIGGHVGSDITAMMLATNLVHLEGISLAIDIGTNGEMVLCKDGIYKSCSTAAGPAFEGACIHFGMRAQEGAIEAVSMNETGVKLQIIRSKEAQGICGSGLIDAIAALLEVGLIDSSGRMLEMDEAIACGVPKILATRMQKKEEQMQFVLQYRYAKDPVVITQQDVREVQLAKGAIAAGMQILLQEEGITEKQVDHFFLAGTFGSYLNTQNAIRIGLLPNLPVEKIHSVGNAAGVGASMALLSEVYQKECNSIAKQTKQLELSMRSEFQETFLQCMEF
ncbi:ASKHA domain-containing protein [Anaerosporobacter faecicola]|uniref:ASKHA domain-containing protein n=1 Tax=Anaerosporobacter faecicola TaxID=2718714 RepID=UPI00143A1DDF|nr:ASKHA domain-containing protein [Anaerosporobacter faecicola]